MPASLSELGRPCGSEADVRKLKVAQVRGRLSGGKQTVEGAPGVEVEGLLCEPLQHPLNKTDRLKLTWFIRLFQMNRYPMSVMEGELLKLLDTAPPDNVKEMKRDFTTFLKLYWNVMFGEEQSIQWDNIIPPSEKSVLSYDSLQAMELPEDMASLLNKLVVVKLNGGLGSSMGVSGPKCLIEVRNGCSFLDLAVEQIEHMNRTYGSDVPLVLMNSFHTDEETLKVIPKYSECNLKLSTFCQSSYPVLSKETMLPLTRVAGKSGDSELWYPPGHGDIYTSLANSGLLKSFLAEGKEYAFISNIDNLGASVDLSILSYLLQPANSAPCDFIMEVTNKTRADVKGGTMIQYDGGLRLLEIAQVPREHVEKFTSVSQFKTFNTNNLWVSLTAMKSLGESDNLDTEIIVNNKTLATGQNVVQLETAAGAAIRNFDRALGVNVPRSRYQPVKNTGDLLLAMSNLYGLEGGRLQLSDRRQFPKLPLIKLGTSFTQ
ncbi:UTP--glucose-1-phosphate uridylyltransferase-like, partial [Callorhinchus milii]|uniref:UTP--glucose-1-phosphate uridylyltransferase-like n=1 Tax=Callorhinchus milii TaxID=7868 RepID=UPI001C3FBCBE